LQKIVPKGTSTDDNSCCCGCKAKTSFAANTLYIPIRRIQFAWKCIHAIACRTLANSTSIRFPDVRWKATFGSTISKADQTLSLLLVDCSLLLWAAGLVLPLALVLILVVFRTLLGKRCSFYFTAASAVFTTFGCC